MDINIKLLININCYSLNSSGGGHEIMMYVLGVGVLSDRDI